MKIFQLRDTDTEDLLGAVCAIPAHENSSFEEELWDGWEAFNKLEEHEGNKEDVNAFVVWFNENYVNQIDTVEVDFIQLFKN